MAENGKKPKIEDLSPQARAAVEQKKVSGQNRLKDWFKLLREVAQFDQKVDELRARAGKMAIIFLILTIVSLIATFVFIFPVILFVIFLVLTIIFFVKKSRLGKIDLSNEFRDVVLPFLDALSEDFDARGRISLSLDMSGVHKEKVIRSGEIPPGRFRKLVETVFKDPWCRVEAPLVGGANLFLTIESTYFRYDRYWRNPRGKNKHKVKWKKLVEVTAGLIPDPDFLAVGADAVEELSAAEKVKLTQKKDRQVVRLRRRFKFKGVTETPVESVSLDELLAIFFQLGNMLRPSQAGS